MFYKIYVHAGQQKKKKDKLQKLVLFHIIPQHYLIRIRSGECVAGRCQYQENHHRHRIHLLGPSKQTHVYHRIILIKMKKRTKKRSAIILQCIYRVTGARDTHTSFSSKCFK